VITTRTPLRITLGGGGTDLPNFYTRHGGFILAMAINKYIYVSAKRTEPGAGIRLNYEDGEHAPRATELTHDLAREALLASGIDDGLEVTSDADIQGGTGLGSSGAFLVGLLHALRSHTGDDTAPDALAEEACRIEMDVLGRSVGKQDQYVAAHGGLAILRIDRDGAVHAGQMAMSSADRARFAASNHLYFTGTTRRAQDVLAEQSRALSAPKEAPQVTDAMLRIYDLGLEILDAVSAGDFDRWGDLMHQHWCEKRKLSAGITVPGLDELYDEARSRFGVRGGKIIGAGGGGFVLMYTDGRHEELEAFMRERGMPRVHYEIEGGGTARIAATGVSSNGGSERPV
jgi:D-glycero-alpha-D-manno-heptose-7-phosphate kinase